MYINVLASVTNEAMWMVRVPQSSDHPPFNKLSTRLAFGTKENMVVLATVV